jgi:hypothetical protein
VSELGWRQRLTSLEGVRDAAEEEFGLSRTNEKWAVGGLCSVWRRTRSGRAGKDASVAVLSQLL